MTTGEKMSELNYTSADAGRVRWWRLVAGCVLVACAGGLVFVSKYLSLAYLRAAGTPGSMFAVMQALPMMIATGLVATAAWLLSGAMGGRGAHKAIALGVVALWVLARMTTDGLMMLDTVVRLPGGWGPALFGICAGLLALVVMVAAFYFVRSGARVEPRAPFYVAAALLVPCVGILLMGVFYQSLRVAATYGYISMQEYRLRPLVVAYTTLYDINFGLLMLVFGGMAVFGAICGVRGVRAKDVS